MDLFDVSKLYDGRNNDLNAPSDEIFQNATSSSFEYPPLPSSSSSASSPFTPKIGSKLMDRNSSNFICYQQDHRQSDLTSSDEITTSRDQDSDDFLSFSGDTSQVHEHSAPDSKGTEELSDLLGSMKLRDKSASSEEDRNRRAKHRHSFNTVPTTHNEIRMGADQPITRRRTLSSSLSAPFKFNTENFFLSNPASPSSHLSFLQNTISPISEAKHFTKSIEELTASPLTSTTNKLLESSKRDAVAMKTSTPALSKETFNSKSQLNLIKTSTDPVRKSSAPLSLKKQPTKVADRKLSSGSHTMSSRSIPSRKTSRPSATSNPTTTASRSAGARASARPTGTSSRASTSSAPKYTEITRGTTGVNTSARKSGSTDLSKGPTFSKTRSASTVGAIYARPSSRNNIGSSDRTTLHATPRSKTPTLSPGFQSLSDKKTAHPTSSASRKTPSLSGASPSSNSLRSPSSQLSAPPSRSQSSNKSTSPTKPSNINPSSPGRSGRSSSTTAAPARRIQSSNTTSNRQTSPLATKTTPRTQASAKSHRTTSPSTSPARSENATQSTSQPRTTLRTQTTSQSRTPLGTTQATSQPRAPLGTTQATSQPRTPLGTTQATSQPRTPLGTTQSTSQPRTPLGTTQATSQPRTPLGTTQATSQPRTPLGTTQATSQPRTPLATQTESTTKAPFSSPQSHIRKQTVSPAAARSPNQTPKYSTLPYTSLSRSKSLTSSAPQAKPTVRSQPQTTQKTSPAKKQSSSSGQPFRRTPITPKQPDPAPQALVPAISVTGGGDKDVFDIPLFVPSRPEGTNHKIQVRNGRNVKRPNRILMQQNASENYLETLPFKGSLSVPSSPALGRSTPDFSDGEDPRNAKLDVKSFKFLLKSREKDSLLLGAAERSPIYTSHEHVLIKVKGKRQVHARITEPKVTSLNKGNAYIYISLQELWLWVGPDVNPAEVSKARSLANKIFKQRELGCKAIFLSEIDYREQTFNTTRTSVLFNALQGREKDIELSSNEDSDEIYEKGMALAAKAYEVLRSENGDYIASVIHEDKYISVKTTLLKTEKVIIFDFGTEVYLWVGKQSASDPQLRKQGEKLAKEIFDNCYNEPTFDPNLILTKTNNATDTLKLFVASTSLMTNRATGQKEKTLEGRAIGTSEKIPTSPKRTSGVTPKSVNTSPARNASANRSKVPSTLVSTANSPRTVAGTTIRRVQTARPSSTPPKKSQERRQVVPSQPISLSRVRSSASKRPSNSDILRPRSQEGNREDMLAPEHKQPVHTNQPRPHYSVLARMNEGAETLLFGDKFSDWKGALGLISTKPAEIGKKNTIAVYVELKPCDTLEMLKERKVPTSIVDPVVKRLQANNVKTVSLRKWLVKDYNNEFKHYERDREEFSIFYSKECYVFKWIYEHASEFSSRNNNVRTKERGMIFFWQGDACSINAKGAVAAISIEIDENGDLHKERLPQGKEDALFLQLFNGEMTIFCGKLDDDHDHDKLFFVRGCHPSEACAIEISQDSEILLNQLGCYIYCCEEEQTLYAWKGSRAPNSQKSCLEVTVDAMALRRNFNIVYLDEGNEPGVLKRLITTSTSIAQSQTPKSFEYTPHLFELSGASGQFIFQQYIPQIYTKDTNSLIFLQLDLYSAQQPSIFMLDAYYEVYVWFGWWPSKTHNSRSHVVSESLTNTGVSDTRWQNDKKLAIQTALNYVKDAGRTNCQVFATFAGSEPESFQRLFPFWNIKKDLIGVCQNDNPFHPQGKIVAEDLLATYTRTRYTYAELTKRPLPEGVDPAKLEMYLSEKEFESIFNMEKTEFAKLALWKQRNLREQHKLY